MKIKMIDFRTKKISLLLLLAAFAIFLGSCGDDEPAFPPPETAFEASALFTEPGREVTFSNSTVGGVNFTWNFGDNSTEVTTINATHTFSEVGTYEVTLTAENDSGNSSQSTVTIVVGRRILVGVEIIAIPELKQTGAPWDEDGSGPELILALRPEDDEFFSILNIIGDLEQEQLPIVGELQGSSLELTNDFWFFVLFDNDEPLDNFEETDLIIGFEANPHVIGTVDNQTGEGFLELISTDGTVHIALDFELKDQ